MYVQSMKGTEGGGRLFSNYGEWANGRGPVLRSHVNILNDSLHTRCGVVGKSPLLRLQGFDIYDQTMPDMMHITSGVLGRNLMGMLTGNRLKKAAASVSRAQSRKKTAREKKAQGAAAAGSRAATLLKKKMNKLQYARVKSKVDAAGTIELDRQVKRMQGARSGELEGAAAEAAARSVELDHMLRDDVHLVSDRSSRHLVRCGAASPLLQV